MNTLLVLIVVLLLIPNVVGNKGMTTKEAMKEELGKYVQMADRQEVEKPKGWLIFF